jgi:iron complex outermembrane receptor protein
MKKAYLAILLLSSQVVATAQTLQGYVKDARSGHPIAGATVELERGMGTVADEDGRFILHKPGTGAQVLRISGIGYKTQTTTATAGKDTLYILLEPWGLLMQPVEVKAIRATNKAPFAKSNISAKEIEANNLGQDLPFLLSQLPSVVVNADAGNGIGYTGIRIRGTDATRINMTINGIPYNDAESQGLFFVNLPDLASSLSSVQVIRGVGTSSNGAGAFGATMNFSTNQVITQPYAELNNGYGSFNSWKHTVKAGTGLLNDHFTVDLRLSRIGSDGYIDRATSDLRSFYFSTAYLTQKSSLRLNILSGKEKTYQAWYGVSAADLKNNRTVNYAGTERPGTPYPNETDNYQQDHYQLFYNHAFNDRWTFQTALYLTKGKGYYEQYKAQQLIAGYLPPELMIPYNNLDKTDLIRQLWLDNTLYGQIFSVQQKQKNHSLTIGGGWNRYNGRHFGEVTWSFIGLPDHYRWYDHDALKTDNNLYAKYEWTLLPGLQAFGDLQYRNIRYRINGFRDNPYLRIDRKYDFFNPKLGLTYSYNRYTYFLSYALGQKEPNREDFETGTARPPLPEQLHDVESGVEYRSGQINWSAGLFYMRYRNQLVLTGEINDVGAYTRTNIPDSYRVGLEVQGRYPFNAWVSLAGNLSLSANRVLHFTEFIDDYDEGSQKKITYAKTDIAYSPALTGQYHLLFNPIKNMMVDLSGRYVGLQYLDNTSSRSRSLQPFFVKDLQMNYTFSLKHFKEIQLLLRINNLLNKHYEPNGYTFSYIYGGVQTTENYYFPMAGTHFMSGVTIKL